jgi:hypothetical protein
VTKCALTVTPTVTLQERKTYLSLTIARLKPDGTRAETTYRLSPKRTSPFKSAGVSVQSTAGSRGVRISGSNAGYTMFRGSVKSTGYPLHSSLSPSLPLPGVTVCHQVSNALYLTPILRWTAVNNTKTRVSAFNRHELFHCKMYYGSPKRRPPNDTVSAPRRRESSAVSL